MSLLSRSDLDALVRSLPGQAVPDDAGRFRAAGIVDDAGAFTEPGSAIAAALRAPRLRAELAVVEGDDGIAFDVWAADVVVLHAQGDDSPRRPYVAPASALPSLVARVVGFGSTVTLSPPPVAPRTLSREELLTAVAGGADGAEIRRVWAVTVAPGTDDAERVSFARTVDGCMCRLLDQGDGAIRLEPVHPADAWITLAGLLLDDEG